MTLLTAPKRCRRCGVEQPLEAFNRRSASRDGRRDECRACQSIAQREDKLRRPEAFREYKRQWRERHLERERERGREYRKSNPMKRSAQDAVKYAVQCGVLVRPDACERCDSRHFRIEGHHEDYSKPLDVQWLCQSCHALRHTELNRTRADGVGGGVRHDRASSPTDRRVA